MGKLMRVTPGSDFLVFVDLRKTSSTLGKWFGIESSDENQRIIWALAGFAHGVCITSETARIQYKCTAPYNAQGESSIRFDDPDLKIEWSRVEEYTISENDRNAQSLARWLASPLGRKFTLLQEDSVVEFGGWD
jgi:dTDP-4-dehydrorhamnose 3,5-epimerase